MSHDGENVKKLAEALEEESIKKETPGLYSLI